MNAYTTVNILDMIKVIGEDGVNHILSDFSCPKNAEIENFIKKNAVDFAKRKMSVTHLVMDDQGKVAAIFTLTHKALKVRDDVLSSTLKKKIKRYAQIDEDTNCYMAPTTNLPIILINGQPLSPRKLRLLTTERVATRPVSAR